MNSNEANSHLSTILVSELVLMQANDAKHRFEIKRLLINKGSSNNAVAELWKKQHTLDSENQNKLATIFKDHGYPGRTLVGEGLKNVALFVVQHSDLEIQIKYFPMIYEAAKKGELNALPVLMLMDRIHTIQHGKQIFKSQSIWNQEKGKYEPVPIDYTVDSNKIRIELGLKPIEK